MSKVLKIRFKAQLISRCTKCSRVNDLSFITIINLYFYMSRALMYAISNTHACSCFARALKRSVFLF